MTIGETIRRYRKLRDLTQAQLANEVGVSVQAISKWETGAGMPDTAQIVPLARALHITTDTLLHFVDRREEFEKLWQKTLKKYGDDPKELLEIAKAALEEYPNDKAFLFRAAMDEERLAETSEQTQEKRAYLHSAMYRMKKLAQEYPEDDDIKVSLVRIYSKLGMDDQAVTLAYQCKNRELALRFCLKGDALCRHRQKIIDRKLRSLLSELSEGNMVMLDAAEGIIRAAIPDGNYQHYYEFLAGIYMKRFDHYRTQGNMDAAYTILRQVLQMAKEADAMQQRQFTAPLFDLLTNINPDDLPDRVWRWLYVYIENEIPQWQDDESLAQIMNDAYAYLKEKKIL